MSETKSKSLKLTLKHPKKPANPLPVTSSPQSTSPSDHPTTASASTDQPISTESPRSSTSPPPKSTAPSPKSTPLPAESKYLIHMAVGQYPMVRTEANTLEEVIHFLAQLVDSPDLDKIQLSICQGLPLRLAPLPHMQLIEPNGTAHTVVDRSVDVTIPEDNDRLSPLSGLQTRGVHRTQTELLNWLAEVAEAEDFSGDGSEPAAENNTSETVPRLEGSTGDIEPEDAAIEDNEPAGEDEDDSFGDEPDA